MPKLHLILSLILIPFFWINSTAEEPEQTQDIYRIIDLSDVPSGQDFFDGSKETMIYDSTDIAQFHEKVQSSIKQIISTNKIDLDEEFLFIINLTTTSTSFKHNLNTLLENDKTLIFQLEVDCSAFLHNCAMGYYHYGFAIKKERLDGVRVERTWLESRPYELRSYELRKYKEELKQPIR